MRSSRWRGVRRLSLSALALAVASAACLVIPAWAQPKRRGEVVRVERARAPARNPIRLCPTPTGDGQLGSCYGSPPQRGERALLFDYNDKFLGNLIVESAESSSKNRCHHDTIFDFSYHARLQGSGNQAVPFSVAVFGMELDTSKARLISNPPDAGQFKPREAKPWMGVDADGDGDAELVVTAYDCSAEAPPPPPSGSQTYETFCLDYWHDEGSRWKKSHRDIFFTCG